jgi:hypothetical protein
VSEIERIAEALRKEAQQHASSSPEVRRGALLEVLRRELDPLPPRELYPYLQELRAQLGGADGETETGSLWESLTGLASRVPETDTGRTRPVAPTSSEGTERLARALLDREFPADAKVTPEILDRLVKVLSALAESIDRSQDAYQFLNMELRKDTDRKSGGTMQIIRDMDSIRKVIARAVLGGGDTSELESRLKKVGGASAVLVHQAYKAGIQKGLESARKLLDPQVIERDQGKDPRAWWLAYRRIYRNEVYELGTDFRIIFLEKFFLDEYFERLKKL